MKVKELLLEVPLPPDWKKGIFTSKTSFDKKLEYALERTKELGSGTSRMVFEIEYQGRPTALKIARNNTGLAQNELEVNITQKVKDLRYLMVPLIDYDTKHNRPVWVHFEKAGRINYIQFKKLTGITIGIFGSMLLEQFRSKDEPRRYTVPSKQQTQIVAQLKFFKDVVMFIKQTDIVPHDLILIGNWGQYKGRPVIIDFGMNKDIHDKYYR